MELHHLHVAQRQPRAQRHRDAVAASCRRTACDTGTSSARRRSRAAPRAPARTRSSPVRMSSMQHAGERRAVRASGSSSTARCSSSRRMRARHTCSASRLMISMPVRSPLCTVRSKVWPANAFWCTVPSGLRSKKQPSSFSSSRMRSARLATSVHASSWSVEPLAALDGVHEVALDRVGRGERDVVAALDHARAAALAEQTLHRDGDRRARDCACCACSAANRPAPPEPRIRMSVSRVCMRSHYARGWGIWGERKHPYYLRRGVRLFPFFLLPERGWSAGRRQDADEASFGGRLTLARRALTAGPLSPGVAAFGARGPNDVGPSASRRSTAWPMHRTTHPAEQDYWIIFLDTLESQGRRGCYSAAMAARSRSSWSTKPAASAAKVISATFQSDSGCGSR